ncbi:MAG: hypothetical protein R3A80_09965 [Bdellovibrionota bacterium]
MSTVMSLPQIEEYERLLPVAKALYTHTNELAWQLLLPLFLVACLMAYFSDLGLAGSVLSRVKKLVLVVLLLAAFPTIAEFSQIIGVEVAKSIDDMSGIDMVLDAAKKRSESYSLDLQGLLNLGNDFVMAVFVLLSYLILVIARFALLAFQHFYWLLLVVLGPFLILGTLFESASGITKGLFKNMFQVAAWPVIWAVLSAFLKVIPFVDAYSSEGGYVTIITLNLIIAIALLFSPFIVSQLCEGVNISIGEKIKGGAIRAASLANPKIAAVAQATAQYTNEKRQAYISKSLPVRKN